MGSIVLSLVADLLRLLWLLLLDWAGGHVAVGIEKVG